MTGAVLLLLAVITGTIATARATRLVTSDAYPPSQALRRWWFNQTVAKGGWRAGWAPLVSGPDGEGGCPFCFAPYAAAVNVAWAVWAGAPWALWHPTPTGWAGWWWLVNLWAAVSYAASMLVVRDEPPAED